MPRNKGRAVTADQYIQYYLKSYPDRLKLYNRVKNRSKLDTRYLLAIQPVPLYSSCFHEFDSEAGVHNVLISDYLAADERVDLEKERMKHGLTFEKMCYPLSLDGLRFIISILEKQNTTVDSEDIMLFNVNTCGLTDKNIEENNFEKLDENIDTFLTENHWRDIYQHLVILFPIYMPPFVGVTMVFKTLEKIHKIFGAHEDGVPDTIQMVHIGIGDMEAYEKLYAPRILELLKRMWNTEVGTGEELNPPTEIIQERFELKSSGFKDDPWILLSVIQKLIYSETGISDWREIVASFIGNPETISKGILSMKTTFLIETKMFLLKLDKIPQNQILQSILSIIADNKNRKADKSNIAQPLHQMKFPTEQLSLSWDRFENIDRVDPSDVIENNISKEELSYERNLQLLRLLYKTPSKIGDDKDGSSNTPPVVATIRNIKDDKEKDDCAQSVPQKRSRGQQRSRPPRRSQKKNNADHAIGKPGGSSSQRNSSPVVVTTSDSEDDKEEDDCALPVPQKRSRGPQRTLPPKQSQKKDSMGNAKGEPGGSSSKRNTSPVVFRTSDSEDDKEEDDCAQPVPQKRSRGPQRSLPPKQSQKKDSMDNAKGEPGGSSSKRNTSPVVVTTSDSEDDKEEDDCAQPVPQKRSRGPQRSLPPKQSQKKDSMDNAKGEPGGSSSKRNTSPVVVTTSDSEDDKEEDDCAQPVPQKRSRGPQRTLPPRRSQKKNNADHANGKPGGSSSERNTSPVVVTTSDSEDDKEEDDCAQPVPQKRSRGPQRSLPPRRSQKKKNADHANGKPGGSSSKRNTSPVVVTISDSEDDKEEDDCAQPVPQKRSRGQQRSLPPGRFQKKNSMDNANEEPGGSPSKRNSSPVVVTISDSEDDKEEDDCAQPVPQTRSRGLQRSLLPKQFQKKNHVANANPPDDIQIDIRLNISTKGNNVVVNLSNP